MACNFNASRVKLLTTFVAGDSALH